MLTEQQLITLISDIKLKKELRAISNEFVRKELLAVLTSRSKEAKELSIKFNHKSKAYTAIIKEVRSRLRRVYGVFREDSVDRTDYNATLATHSSTKERLPFYEEIYKQIFAITGRPKIILDLGCGVNPLSISYMKPPRLSDIRYYAYDINEQEIELLNNFFTDNHIHGHASVLDITDARAVANLIPADVAFLFKVTDVLDRGKGHKKTEEIIKSIPATYVIISFSTKTLSGKPMTAPRRNWMEWLCNRLGYTFQILEFENEIFYVIRRI